MKKFKKIYIEITNNCNLACNFCIKANRNKEFMDKKKFLHILTCLKNYTDYLYFHILGEPLLHPDINEFIDIASEHYKINITTNGYLINNIKDNKNIRQLNISLHSFDSKYTNLDEYLNNIFNVTKELLKKGTIINYRIWTSNKDSEEIIRKLNDYYNASINLKRNFTLQDNVFINQEKEFEWPDINNKKNYFGGNCLGLKDHIGILVDGTVIPCCLDTKGDINLGNIFTTDLEDILNSTRCQKIINNFKENKKCELLCQKCSFYDLKKTNVLE